MLCQYNVKLTAMTKKLKMMFNKLTFSEPEVQKYLITKTDQSSRFIASGPGSQRGATTDVSEIGDIISTETDKFYKETGTYGQE